jgi:hypothetical protein
MDFMTKIFGWMLVSRRKESPQNHPELNPLDLEDLKTELGIEHQARRLGEVGLPRPTDTALSGPENRIVQRLEEARRDHLNWATSRLKSIQIKMHNCDITKTFNRAMEAANEFERTANSRLSDYEANIGRLKTVAMEREEDLRVFKLNNNLTQAANVISGWRTFSFICLSLLIVVVEGALNASFFAKSLDGGLIQGFGYAFGLALMNVLIALTLGRIGVPNKNHINHARRVIGYMSILLSISLMVTMGLLIAHFRDSLSQGLDNTGVNPGVVALQTLINNTFGLSDIYSWMLFAFSVFFGLFSLAEGYYWQDAYPGYGRVQHAADKAVVDYEESIAEVRELLEQLKNEHLEAFETSLDDARSSVLGYKEQIHEKRSTRHRLQQFLHKAENMLDALIAIFRTDNTLHRRNSVAEVPAYFNNRVKLQEIEFPDFDTTDDEKSLKKQELMLARLLHNVEQIRAGIQSSFDQKFDQLKPIREQLK